MPYLVLNASFISGRYGGEEWPPAPMRLLQAIVAGVRGSAHPALTWLESQSAPDILAESDPPLSHIRTFVPNNTAKGTPATPDERTARDRHVRRIDHPISYVWKVQESDASVAAELVRLAASVHTLGTGHDMCNVQGGIVAQSPLASDTGRTWWRPCDLGCCRLRRHRPKLIASVRTVQG